MFTTELLEGFNKAATASIADAIDKVCGRRGFLDHHIKPRINETRICGPAVTVLEMPTTAFVPPQFALDAIDESPPGSVIAIAIADGEPNVAVWGGLMTAGAVANGHNGAVLDGAVRDISEIRRDYQFPIYARSASPGTTLGRYRTVERGTEVRLGGVLVRQGDLLVGDIDGVVCVPAAHAAEVLKLAQEIDAREAEQAKLIIEAKSLRQGLAKYGRI